MVRWSIDNLHCFWHCHRSVSGAVFHSKFMVLQTMSSNANKKVSYSRFTTYHET